MIDLECPRCGANVEVMTGDHGLVHEGETAHCIACNADLQVVCNEVGACECSSRHCKHAFQGYIEYEAALVETDAE